jgi:hypothetical protein
MKAITGGGVAKTDSLDHLDHLTLGEDGKNREDRQILTIIQGPCESADADSR